MSRPDEAAELLRRGNPPSRIAQHMGVTVSTVLGYLYRQAGEGKIQRSDIILSIDRGTRALIEEAVRASKRLPRPWWVKKWVRKRRPSIDPEDVQIYLSLRAGRVQFGDLYESLRAIETFLHETIRRALMEESGPAWWRQIPEDVRLDCTSAREKDSEPAGDPFCYTTLIHLKKIIDKRWPAIARQLPAPLGKDKKALLSRLDRLNSIRNSVMHPVKGVPLTDEDFVLVRAVQRELSAEVDKTWHQLLAASPVTDKIQ